MPKWLDTLGNNTLSIAICDRCKMKRAYSDIIPSDSMTAAFLNTNSTFYTTFVTVDGTSTNVVTKWQGGSVPASGNTGIDTYSFSIIKTAASTYTVLASQTQFN